MSSELSPKDLILHLADKGTREINIGTGLPMRRALDLPGR
jgi:hypothetical protein